jgi:hypothetical protein
MGQRMPSADKPLYASKIIKAGALLADTKTLLSHWDVRTSVQKNMERMHRENVFGKASRSRVEDVLAIVRQRYLTETSVTRALVALVTHRFPPVSLDRILYFHTAKSDRLFYDIVTEFLRPLTMQGITDIDVIEVEKTLVTWVSEGKTMTPWGAYTMRRVAQGLLAALRDFGVLEGAVNKRIAPAYLPVEAFAYIMFYLKQHQPSGVKLLDLADWQLFFLPREGVERFLVETHQHGLLAFHAAGSVIRLTFPVDDLEEYAHVLAARASCTP